MLKRVFQTAMALGLGHLLQILAQWCLPPLFLASFGVEGFAQWLLLTAVVSHLSTLDFGLQTFLVNELTLLRQRGDTQRFHVIQSVGLRLAAGLTILGLILCFGAWRLPLHPSLGSGLSEENRRAASLLGIQVLGLVLFGQMSGLFRVAGHPRIGAHWQNAQRSIHLATTAVLAAMAKPFWIIALGQCLSMMLVFWVMMWSLARRFPDVLPRWGRWDRVEAVRIVRQSACFGLFSINQVLVFQLPLLLLAHFADATSVVAFSTARTLFSSVRQISNVALAALSPELTRMMGLGDRVGLARTYAWAEPVLYAISLVGGMCVFVLSPGVISAWLRKPEVFHPTLFAVVFAASLCMQVKELKLYFQHATNEHVPTAVFTAATYALMLFWGPLALQGGQALGLVVGWVVTEVVQTIYIHRCNARLVGAEGALGWTPTVKLWIACVIAWAAFSSTAVDPVLLRSLNQWPKTAAFCAITAIVAFLLFRGPQLLRELLGRLRRTAVNNTTLSLHHIP